MGHGIAESNVSGDDGRQALLDPNYAISMYLLVNPSGSNIARQTTGHVGFRAQGF